MGGGLSIPTCVIDYGTVLIEAGRSGTVLVGNSFYDLVGPSYGTKSWESFSRGTKMNFWQTMDITFENSATIRELTLGQDGPKYWFLSSPNCVRRYSIGQQVSFDCTTTAGHHVNFYSTGEKDEVVVVFDD